MTSGDAPSRVRLHLTNVAGVGASQLLQSLLPALERVPGVHIEHIYLPNRGPLAGYRSSNPETVVSRYERVLPNSLSRVAECTWLANQFEGSSPLVVFGDLPLRCRSTSQTVFLQTPKLLHAPGARFSPPEFKYVVARAVFRLNKHRARRFIVQTDLMRRELERVHPDLQGRIRVVPQPVPAWLLRSGLSRRNRLETSSGDLRLIYPAAGYPHKNHALLGSLNPQASWPVERLLLTLDSDRNPAPQLPWVTCAGLLDSAQMIAEYGQADALLFLSKQESYGFPLVEAMFIGLPIVCADLPYARVLCGDQAIYFDPDSGESLLAALRNLRDRLENGWWPQWDAHLARIPRDWETVAEEMLKVALEAQVD